eukprot:8517660-Alexandrium_andersonii.AAC.1
MAFTGARQCWYGNTPPDGQMRHALRIQSACCIRQDLLWKTRRRACTSDMPPRASAQCAPPDHR